MLRFDEFFLTKNLQIAVSKRCIFFGVKKSIKKLGLNLEFPSKKKSSNRRNYIAGKESLPFEKKIQKIDLKF